VDEVADNGISPLIHFSAGIHQVTRAELFTNPNRRNRTRQEANGEGMNHPSEDEAMYH